MDAVRFHISCEIKLRNGTTYASQNFRPPKFSSELYVFLFSVTYICTRIPVFRIHSNKACRIECSVSGAHQHKTASSRKDIFQTTLNAWECMQSLQMKYHNQLKENMNLFENTQ